MEQQQQQQQSQSVSPAAKLGMGVVAAGALAGLGYWASRALRAKVLAHKKAKQAKQSSLGARGQSPFGARKGAQQQRLTQAQQLLQQQQQQKAIEDMLWARIEPQLAQIAAQDGVSNEDKAEQQKAVGNEFFAKQQFALALRIYSSALLLDPTSYKILFNVGVGCFT
ncbi:MAG: hypothetical protein MHM6MM_009397, partial [Cercozoa sp. M6MM]